MKTQELNLFIVDDDKSMAMTLEHYLNELFGNKLNISTFYDGESCLANINSQTDVVILDYFLKGKNGNEILRSIKKLNPRIEVIMLSGNESLETAVMAFELGAKNYVVKSKNAVRKIAKLIKSFFAKPVNSIKKISAAKATSFSLMTFFTIVAIVNLLKTTNKTKTWNPQKK
jgi:DNA-binding NtrC family response regulator